MTEFKHILRRSEWAKDWESGAIKAFYEHDGMTTNENPTGSLWDCNHHKGWYSALVEKNGVKARQHFYVCGRLDEFANHTYKKTEAEKRFYHDFHLMNALLSDYQPLIQRYIRLKYPRMIDGLKKRNEGLFPQTLMSVLRQDWEVVDFVINRITNHKLKDDERYIAWRNYFTGLRHQQQPQVEEALAALLQPPVTTRLNQNFLGWEKDLIVPQVVVFAKVAKLRGMDITLNHPMIPNELIDIKPNDEYDDLYDFLKTFKLTL